MGLNILREKTVRMMYQDKAGFGRINSHKRCWSPKGKRPIVSCYKVKEYRYCYGAVDPIVVNSFFIMAGNYDTEWMN